MDIKVKLGEKVKELRNSIGLSQEKFAHKCELDRTYIASIEAGKRNVSIINIEKIANALGVTVSELLKGI